MSGESEVKTTNKDLRRLVRSYERQSDKNHLKMGTGSGWVVSSHRVEKEPQALPTILRQELRF
jgi:hypothetical protein